MLQPVVDYLPLIDVPNSIMLFIIVVAGTLTLLMLNRWFSPLDLLNLIRATNELKRLDKETANEVHRSGFITKMLFRIFSRGAERYFP
jgi:hypothetical protein